jgi:hypothetical protein
MGQRWLKRKKTSSRIKVFLLGLLSPIFLTACNSRQSIEVPCNSVPSLGNGGSSLTPSNEGLTLELHVDGSASMTGYVTLPTSRYRTVLGTIAKIFSLSDNIASGENTERPVTATQYFRTGFNKQSNQTVQQNLSRSQFESDAQTQEFYEGKAEEYKPLTSQITNVIDSTDPTQKVIAIITDLGQDAGDVTVLNESIQKSIFSTPGSAVAILGIRSEFDGVVYDPSTGRRKFEYSTKDQSDQAYRPFYVILAGSFPAIQDLLLQIKNRIPFAFETSIFYPNVLKPTFAPPMDNSKGMSPVRSFQQQQGRESWILKLSDRYQAFSLNSPDSLTQNPQISLELDSNPDISQFLNIPTALKVIARKFDPSTQDFIDPPSPQGVSLGNLQLTKDTPSQITYDLTISPEELANQEAYIYAFRLQAEALTTPDWWQAWDADQVSPNNNPEGSKPDQVSPNNNLEGSKTDKLSNFLEGMNDITAEKMETGELCYGFQYLK